jgi:hypothetical protein
MDEEAEEFAFNAIFYLRRKILMHKNSQTSQSSSHNSVLSSLHVTPHGEYLSPLAFSKSSSAASVPAVVTTTIGNGIHLNIEVYVYCEVIYT